jgi:hypothetical protein
VFIYLRKDVVVLSVVVVIYENPLSGCPTAAGQPDLGVSNISYPECSATVD